ncbi:flavodoxin domain-containing protein [Dysgonomonas sp. Marseille-Q5470]|uniref:flavodoxin family protein n=1 Tax=Dysgonomonas sp. Marseille-Q5470 TaxID=3039494 RepID=UPI0024BCB2B3|nr:flavodoxin domain-containing protein [Dysgonomonas sp. Marseille-Q5470]
MKNIHLIYFSPSLSTRKIIREIGKEMGATVREHDVTMGFPDTLNIESHDLVIFGFPVYAGRVPQLAVNAFEKIKGDKRLPPCWYACMATETMTMPFLNSKIYLRQMALCP